jgi:hypothetical protein
MYPEHSGLQAIRLFSETILKTHPKKHQQALHRGGNYFNHFRRALLTVIRFRKGTLNSKELQTRVHFPPDPITQINITDTDYILVPFNSSSSKTSTW